MIPKLVSIFLFLNVYIISHCSSNEMFKVPLEIRQKNRPKRLVDESTDPDLKMLKEIQDQFFNIVGNSSAGKEFKSFSQLLQLIDSKSGRELGKLMSSGFMIAFRNENSNQILSEFLDDFQYRVSPDLADALVDYTEFVKTIDLKMLPLTIQTLFRKDELGNSLAQIPLGQLVDFVQPEASKYGIDIRGVINGILGKGGDSTFPDLVRKLIQNFDPKSIINNVSKTFGKPKEQEATANEVINTKEEIRSQQPENKKRVVKDKTLLLFKPLLAKLLKENNVDLDVDAVIQVMTPFVSPLIQSFMGGSDSQGTEMSNNNIDTNNNKDSGLAQLLPLITMFASQYGNGQGSKGQPNMMELAMSLLGGMNKDPNTKNKLETVLNLASSIFAPRKAKTGSHKKKEKPEKPKKAAPPEFDMETLMKLADTLTAKDPELDNSEMLKMTSKLVGDLPKEEQIKMLENLDLGEDVTLAETLDKFLLHLQKDTNVQTKLHDATALAKTLFASKIGNLEQIKDQISQFLTGSLTQVYMVVSQAFLLPEKEFDDLMTRIDDKEVRDEMIKNGLNSVREIIDILSSDKFQKVHMPALAANFQSIFTAFGVKGITLINFPDKMEPVIRMMTRGWNLPVKLEDILEPLQLALMDTKIWFLANLKALHTMPEDAQKEAITQSFHNDIAIPLVKLWRISKASKSTPSCLPRAICDYVNEVSDDYYLRLMVMRFGSIIYSSMRSDKEDNFMLLVQAARASVFRGDCKEYFPHECSKVKETKKSESKKSEEAEKPKHAPHTEL